MVRPKHKNGTWLTLFEKRASQVPFLWGSVRMISLHSLPNIAKKLF